MSKRVKKNPGFHPKQHAKGRLFKVMQSILSARFVNEDAIEKLRQGIQGTNEETANLMGGVSEYIVLANEELEYFMRLQAGVAADVRLKIRGLETGADEIGLPLKEKLETPAVKWAGMAAEFERALAQLDDIELQIIQLGQQLGVAQMSVAEVFAERYQVVEFFTKYTTPVRVEQFGKAANSSELAGWGLHATSTTEEIKRFLDEKFSYAAVLGIPVSEDDVSEEEAEIASDLLDRTHDVVDAEFVPA